MSKRNHSINLNSVYTRDKGICWICNEFCPREQATRDHVIAYAHGGPNNLPNIRIAHPNCNVKRGSSAVLTRIEKLRILLECQKGDCRNCCEPLLVANAIIKYRKFLGGSRHLAVAVCGKPCKAYIPIQKEKVVTNV